ncbi:ABC transporter permease [Desulfovibrio sp. OttesenSCG-928-A18]|nr:ABC transporter permease [Desulfovibrio sp. OttesenSCG-928-A18]
MNKAFSQALALQGRVLWSLALREIHGLHGRFRIGYLWQLIKTGFFVATFLMIHSLMGVPTPRALPLPIMLLMGFIPWFIFSDTINRTMEAVRTNKPLLTFPQISPLDLFCSSALVVWVTELVIMGLYFFAFHFMGVSIHFYAPITFFLALAGLCAFSLGLGLFLAAINLYVPIMEKLVPMVLRVLFFTSGIFFSPNKVGIHYSNLLFWNPLTNFIELLRSCFVHPSPPSIIKMDMIICCSFGFLFLGLLLERFVRAKQEAI